MLSTQCQQTERRLRQLLQFRQNSSIGSREKLNNYNAVITIAIRLRHDYDPTTTYRARLLPIRRKQKMNMSIFRSSRIVVKSQS